MKRKIIIAAAVTGVVIAGFGTMFWYKTWGIRAPVVNGTAMPSPSATPVPAELVTWNDQAGFSFSYPKNLSVNAHEEDQDNYAHIEFTEPSHPGKLIVWAKDTTAVNAGAWLSAVKEFSGGVAVDTKLGGLDAKKVLISGGAVRKAVVGTVSDQIVFYVETDLEDPGYWQEVANTVVGSFAFTPEGGGSSDGGAPAEEQPADEEEEVSGLRLPVA